MIRPIVFTAKGMAKHPPLSVGVEKTKHFDFTLDDDDFEGHTWRFIPAATATETLKCIKKKFKVWRGNETLFSSLAHTQLIHKQEVVGLVGTPVIFFPVDCIIWYGIIEGRATE